MNFRIQDTSEIYTLRAVAGYELDPANDLSKKIGSFVVDCTECHLELPYEFDEGDSRILLGGLQRFLLKSGLPEGQKTAARLYLKEQLFPVTSTELNSEMSSEIARRKACGELIGSFVPHKTVAAQRGSVSNFSEELARLLAWDRIDTPTGSMARIAA